MSARRSPEQVHEEDGHPTLVASCSLCHAEPAADEPSVELVGEHGPEPWFPDMPLAENLRMPPPKKRGQCIEPGCTNKGTHRDGRCCGCHCRPGRTA